MQIATVVLSVDCRDAVQDGGGSGQVFGRNKSHRGEGIVVGIGKVGVVLDKGIDQPRRLDLPFDKAKRGLDTGGGIVVAAPIAAAVTLASFGLCERGGQRYDQNKENSQYCFQLLAPGETVIKAIGSWKLCEVTVFSSPFRIV